jgi:CheY-like chemotaxis protein
METDRCTRPFTLLVADDDEDDQTLIREAVEVSCDCFDLQFVNDGQELMDYLYQNGKLADTYPDLIILDLNMPGRDGLSALHEINGDPDFQLIPIVVFTTTRDEEAVLKSYGLGANSFIPKPMTFGGLAKTVECISKYWCEVATLATRKEVMECNVVPERAS